MKLERNKVSGKVTLRELLFILACILILGFMPYIIEVIASVIERMF